MKKTIVATLALIFSLGAEPAKADVTPLAITMLLVSGWTTFMIIDDASYGSADSKEALLGTASEDAAAFIANDGQNPSALLSQLIASARTEIAKSGATDTISDIELAQAILHAAEKAE